MPNDDRSGREARGALGRAAAGSRHHDAHDGHPPGFRAVRLADQHRDRARDRVDQLRAGDRPVRLGRGAAGLRRGGRSLRAGAGHRRGRPAARRRHRHHALHDHRLGADLLDGHPDRRRRGRRQLLHPDRRGRPAPAAGAAFVRCRLRQRRRLVRAVRLRADHRAADRAGRLGQRDVRAGRAVAADPAAGAQAAHTPPGRGRAGGRYARYRPRPPRRPAAPAAAPVGCGTCDDAAPPGGASRSRTAATCC